MQKGQEAENSVREASLFKELTVPGYVYLDFFLCGFGRWGKIDLEKGKYV